MIDQYSVILLIAGKGARCNLPLNKVFYEIDNKPLFTYSLDVFLKDNKCKDIVIVHSENDVDYVNESLKDYNDCRIRTTYGGIERQNSVFNGLLKAKCEYVLVHDGARANINQILIDRVLEGFKVSDCVSLGVKVSDTIKKVTDKVETIERNDLYYMQTPQGAKTDLLKMCLEKAEANNDVVTDDLMAIEKYSNVTPKIVLGNKTNIKVTTIEDIGLLKYYMENVCIE